MLVWLKSKEIGLGHVHANFIILYLRLRTNDPKLSAQSRKRAHSTGYKERAMRSKKEFLMFNREAGFRSRSKEARVEQEQ